MVLSGTWLQGAGSLGAIMAFLLGYVSVVAFEAVALPTTMEYLLPEGYRAGFLWTIAGYDVYAWPWLSTS